MCKCHKYFASPFPAKRFASRKTEPVEKVKITDEPPRDKTNKMACAPSEDSDQPGHPPSLIRVFVVLQWVAKDPSFLHADSEDSDQTWRMLRLTRVFAGRTTTLLVLTSGGSIHKLYFAHFHAVCVKFFTK